MLLTLDQLRAFAPGSARARAELIGAVINGEGADHGLTTPGRLHHFMAQIAHESGGFMRLEESLTYTAPRLMVVWPSRFRTLNEARLFENKPYDLAEKVYGGRLGNDKPGDGWKYRGRGLVQITGKANYAEAEDVCKLPLVLHPELAAEADDAARIALAFWRSRGCNTLADMNDIEGITRKINGGLNGLEDRARWLAKARKVFR